MATGRNFFEDISLIVIGLLLLGAVYQLGSYNGGKKEYPNGYENGYTYGEKTGHNKGYQEGYDQASEECIQWVEVDRAQRLGRLKSYNR